VQSRDGVATDLGTPRAAIVTGATGLVGRHLVPLLLDGGYAVQAVSRRPPPAGGGAFWRSLDLREDCKGHAELGASALLFHTAPLPLLPARLEMFADLGVRRIVAFSSTSRWTKESSRSSRERETARRLADAETDVAEQSRRRDIRWTIFRPTLIYGGGHDRNVSDIARWIERFGFFPMAGTGRGLRQPVHAEDLAAACLAVPGNNATFDRTYDLPGGEALPYREMVARVAGSMGRKPRFLRLPLGLMRAAFTMARALPRYAHLSAEMIDRMDEDLFFDASPAHRDFGYRPRPFRLSDVSSAGEP